MIKVGDKVKYTDESLHINPDVFVVKTLHEEEEDLFTLHEEEDHFVDEKESLRTISWVKLVEESVVEYEDGWTLNEGKAEIPPDAKTLKDNTGDVVAFKKVRGPFIKEFVAFVGKTVKGTNYCLSHSRFGRHKIKVVFVETDGVLTDVRLG